MDVFSAVWFGFDSSSCVATWCFCAQNVLQQTKKQLNIRLAYSKFNTQLNIWVAKKLVRLPSVWFSLSLLRDPSLIGLVGVEFEQCISFASWRETSNCVRLSIAQFAAFVRALWLIVRGQVSPKVRNCHANRDRWRLSESPGAIFDVCRRLIKMGSDTKCKCQLRYSVNWPLELASSQSWAINWAESGSLKR